MSDIFEINYENGKEVLDVTPIPRTPRIGSGSLYETILLAMKNEKLRNSDEEYDTMEEHFDLYDDEDECEDIPLTDYEKSAIEMERAMFAVDNPTNDNNTASTPQNVEAGTTPPSSATDGGGVSQEPNAPLD